MVSLLWSPFVFETVLWRLWISEDKMSPARLHNKLQGWLCNAKMLPPFPLPPPQQNEFMQTSGKSVQSIMLFRWRADHYCEYADPWSYTKVTLSCAESMNSLRLKIRKLLNMNRLLIKELTH